MKYVFGPVASRRFGMSLGVDLSPDKKRCNFDCIYCELEGAKPVGVYENPPKPPVILDEINEAVEKFDFDVLTITSNGEPTLYPYLDELTEGLKGHKLLILSNSSTITDPKIQKTLCRFDIVKLSLDSAVPETFKKIDRPLKGFDIEKIISSMAKFSKIYDGELIIEIMVVKGINDKKEEFEKLNEALAVINPKRVDISTIDRPPAYRVEAVDTQKLFELSGYIHNQHIFIPTRENLNFRIENLTKEHLLTTLKKRPFSQNDVDNVFDSHTRRIFNDLLKEKLIEEVWVGGVKFYKSLV